MLFSVITLYDFLDFRFSDFVELALSSFFVSVLSAFSAMSDSDRFSGALGFLVHLIGSIMFR